MKLKKETIANIDDSLKPALERLQSEQEKEQIKPEMLDNTLHGLVVSSRDYAFAMEGITPSNVRDNIDDAVTAAAEHLKVLVDLSRQL